MNYKKMVISIVVLFVSVLFITSFSGVKAIASQQVNESKPDKATKMTLEIQELINSKGGLSEKYTLIDAINEYKRNNNIQAQKRVKFWERKPKNTAEEEFFDCIKRENQIRKQLLEIRNNFPTDYKSNKKYKELLNKLVRQHELTLTVMEKHGISKE